MALQSKSSDISNLRAIVTEPIDKNHINHRVIELIAEVMSIDPEDIDIDTDLSGTLGADSMDIVTISAGLSDEFEIDIDLAEVPETGVTVSWITSEVGSLLAQNC